MKALEELRNNEETGSSFVEAATPVHNPQRRKAMGPVELGNLQFFQDKKKARRGGMGPDELEQLEQIQAMLPSDRLSERRGAITAHTLSPEQWNALASHGSSSVVMGDSRKHQRRGAMNHQELGTHSNIKIQLYFVYKTILVCKNIFLFG